MARPGIGHEPLGVVANISAWNYPWFVGCNVILPALATGNAVLYKPSEYAPLTGLAIARQPACDAAAPAVLGAVGACAIDHTLLLVHANDEMADDQIDHLETTVDLLHEVAVGAGGDGLVDVFVIHIRREDEDAEAGVAAEKFAAGGEAVAVGQAQIQEDNVGTERVGGGQRLLDGGGFTDDDDGRGAGLVRDHRADAVAHELAVVDDEEADFSGRVVHREASASG